MKKIVPTIILLLLLSGCADDATSPAPPPSSTGDEAYKPYAGDLIFYQWPGGGHTGIVIGYNEDKDVAYTIEGNHDAKRGVWFRTVPLDGSSPISGFGVNGGHSYGFIPPEIR